MLALLDQKKIRNLIDAGAYILKMSNNARRLRNLPSSAMQCCNPQQSTAACGNLLQSNAVAHSTTAAKS